MSVSKAQMEATRRWESGNYDQIRLVVPKGTKARIRAQSASINGYISAALMAALARDEAAHSAPDPSAAPSAASPEASSEAPPPGF